MKRWYLALLGCVLLLSSGAILVNADEESTLPAGTPWHELPLPEGRSGISDIAVEKNGALWSLMRGGIYYWDGSGFQIPEGGEFESGRYIDKFIGGTDRELYVTQIDEREDQGKLFRLKEGVAEYVTDFEYTDRGELPNVHVSRSGAIYNWGEQFLAIYSDGAWQRHRLAVGAKNVQVVEFAERVCILGENPEQLYVIDAGGHIEEQQFTFGDTVPLKKPPRIVPWGDRRLLALSKEVRSVLAFDTALGEPVDTDGLNRQLNDAGVWGAFGDSVGLARNDGSVWLRAHSDGNYAFASISPTGEAQQVEGSSSRAWRRGTFVTFPNVVRETRDGAMWFALDDTTIARFHGGQLRRFDWRDGLSYGKFNHLQEGDLGEVYAASSSAIVVWRPAELRPAPAWTSLWEEYETASYVPIRDHHGNVWMMLRDRPGEISCWDGAAWRHQGVPFDTAKIYSGIADDQGHVLLIGSPECYDISPSGVETFPDAKPLVVAAVARGAKRFDGGNRGCIVDGNQIWIGTENSAEVQHYDGEGWEMLSLRDGFQYILESTEYGVLLSGQDSKFYTNDRGRLKFVTDTSSHTRWLHGSGMMQPYEAALLDRRPRDYVITQHGQLTIRVKKMGSDGVPKTSYLPGDMMPRGWWLTLTRGWRRGHWTDYAAGPIYRLLGNRVIECDWQQTPLFGRVYEVRQVIEDRAGNLWTYAGRQVFMKRPGDFKLESVGVAQIAGHEAHLEVKAADSWQGGYQPRVFWRVAGGAWQGGEATNQITVPLAESGETVVKIIGMDRLGATTEPLRQRILVPD